MTYVPKSGAVVPEFTLAADWTNTSTITVNYPSGFKQTSFTNGMSVPNRSYMMVNRNDKIFEDVTGVAQITLTFGSSNVTVTNKTGATIVAGTVLSFWFEQRTGSDADLIAIPLPLVSISAADLIVVAPGLDGFIENLEFLVTTAATTAAKLATLSAKINSVAVTGGAVALTSANCTPIGARIPGTQITAANRITKNDVLTITGSAVTAFVEGSGTLYVRLRPDTL